jgi:hypothetical protein
MSREEDASILEGIDRGRVVYVELPENRFDYAFA